MSLILDGTNGLSDVDGSAATPAIRGSDANTGVFFGTDIVGVSTGGSERMQVDASGNVGIGVSPSAWGTASTVLELKNGATFAGFSSKFTIVGQNAYSTASSDIYINNGFASQYYQVDGTHVWRYAASGTAGASFSYAEAMRIDSSGNLLIATTTPATVTYGTAVVTAGNSARCVLTDVGVFEGQAIATSLQFVAIWKNPNGAVGSITTDGSATAYNTSSDYRLKHDIQPMTGALAKVQQLKPVTYKWKVDGSDGQGFIAHELAEVEPGCVSGEKDGVETYTDEDGVKQTRPRYQGIDTSFLVATLAAAIQELKGINDAQAQIITALTARVEALEGAQA
jgi:hypothetical protein